MTFAADLVARIEGAVGHARVYPVEAPVDVVLPYVVYRRASVIADDTLDDGSVHSALYVVELHAVTYAEAVETAAALKPQLDNWTGALPDSELMSMSFAGEHDGPGSFDEEMRRRRSFSRELMFAALLRA